MSTFNNPFNVINAEINVSTELSDAEQIEAFRTTPLNLESNTFGLALVLGGTVSAGAFTAGVLDFLVEALDEWQRIRDEEDKKVKNGEMRDSQRTAPTHKVSLTLITGSSGGSVCGGILSRFLGFSFPHIRLNPNNVSEKNEPEIVPIAHDLRNHDTLCPSDNPFWNVWVDKLRIEKMLTSNSPTDSILSADAIEDAAESIAKNPNENLSNIYRSWIHSKFNIVLAYTNLRGIPTKINYMGNSQSFMEHADFIRYGIDPTVNAKSKRKKACYESKLLTSISKEEEWKEFIQFVMGSAAFPIGFPARELSRDITDYRYYPVILPQEAHSEVEVIQLPIDNNALADGNVNFKGDYSFLAVDAGITDNAPVEIARSYLSGIGNRNNRSSLDADRAVLLIDPFVERCIIEKEEATKTPKFNKSILSVIPDLLKGMIQESRYHTRDLIFSTDENIKSRFVLTAQRPDPLHQAENIIGGKALCSSRFGAFFGFFDVEFSKHDYFLGRYCCQNFLKNKTQFWLPDNNEAIGNSRPKGELIPIIPLLGSAAVIQRIPNWPDWNNFNPDSLKLKIKKRIELVISSQLKLFSKNKIYLIKILLWLIKSCFINYAVKSIIELIKDSKNDKSLPPI